MVTTIHNEYLTLSVDTHGAEAVSLQNKSGEEILWQADPTVWNRHSPILFPWTGKLANGMLTYEGKSYRGRQHGFIQDLEHTLLKSEGNIIQLEYCSDDELKTTQFPFDFRLVSTFLLDGNTVDHSLTVENTGTEELRFGIGFHPGFNIPFDENHATTDYELRFEQEESPIILDCLPHGLLSGKSFYQWKNTEKIDLTDDLFDNDSFCFAGLRSNSITICEKDTGRRICCDISDYPYVLLWSAPTKPMRFVCVEPWQSLPAAETDNSEWNEHAAAACLKPGQSYTTRLKTIIQR